jgi:anti-sigma B factor antagonist
MSDGDGSPQTARGCPGRPAITVTVSRPQPKTTVCSVTGAVDWNTRPLLKKALTEARQDDNTHLVIDLSAVTFMDAAGPYTLLEARVKHHLHGGGHLAVITNPNATTIPELHGVAIRAAFDVHPTVADALNACAHAQTATNHPPPGLTTPADFACQG